MTLRTRMATIAILLTPLLAQSLAFEVASVKPVGLPPGAFSFENPNAVVLPKIAGIRVTVSGSLTSLIRSAYNVKGNRILGAPDWATPSRGDTYNLIAQTGGEG